MATQEQQIANIYEDTEAFRDSIATVDKQGKRIWLYPKKPSGRFYRWRTWVSFVFLAIFLTLPFIKLNGEPFFMLNVIERKFILFGLLFTPQDFHIFGLVMLTFLVFIILFTVVFGRLFCGWVCPQTVFMEMFFRRIEYWIEGDAPAQRRLDKMPWNAEKIRKKGLKHVVFFLIAVIVSNYFLAYIIGMDQVLRIIGEPLGAHLGGFVAMILFSGAFYGVFARLREQVCTTICPYGRLQGVLLVKESIVVAYDYVRGEPRGKVKKNPVADIQTAVNGSASGIRKTGDCVDCKMCIAVCPTGIDIRNGTQLECTNCTACIDACDEIMDKTGRKRGLIRYDSAAGIERGSRKIFTPRVIAYSGLLAALIVLDVILLAGRGSIEAIILRSPGQLFQERDETHLTNLYTYKLINKTTKDLPVSLRVATPGAQIEPVGQAVSLIPKGKRAEGAFFVIMPKNMLQGRKTPVVFEVWSEGKKMDAVKSSFMGPVQ